MGISVSIPIMKTLMCTGEVKRATEHDLLAMIVTATKKPLLTLKRSGKLKEKNVDAQNLPLLKSRLQLLTLYRWLARCEKEFHCLYVTNIRAWKMMMKIHIHFLLPLARASFQHGLVLATSVDVIVITTH